MRSIGFTNHTTGETKFVKVPECIYTPVVCGGIAAGLTIVGAFFYGLVEDGIDLAKKLFKK